MKFAKIMIIGFLTILCLSFWNLNCVYAVDLKSLDEDSTSFLKAGKDGAGDLEPVQKAMTENFMGLGQILTMVGAGVMVAVISYMGIKYLVSPPDKQAALKQQLIGVVVAGIVIFGAYGIWSAILRVVSHF